MGQHFFSFRSEYNIARVHQVGSSCMMGGAGGLVLLIFTTPLYHSCVYFLFALFSDEPEVFISEYSQTAILHAAHFRRVVIYKEV